MDQDRPLFAILVGEDAKFLQVGEACAKDVLVAAFSVGDFLANNGLALVETFGKVPLSIPFKGRDAKVQLRARCTDEQMGASIAKAGIAVLFVDKKRMCVNHIRSGNSGDACEEARAVMAGMGRNLILSVTPLMATFFLQWPPESRWEEEARKKLALVGMK